ncbi:MAG TPA: hypothetical protein VN285_00630 [Candidatus Deferrimicrobium sp.]|nr:hypothetical protein [Candidatus Deferrimicrobium sp.]
MSSIKRDTYRKLFLLYAISRFSSGVMGKTRLQKAVYEATKRSPRKPFSYSYHNHGQFSVEVMDTCDALELMEYISKTPLRSRKGFQYTLTGRGELTIILSLIGKVDSESREAIDRAISEVGFLQERELIERMHKELENQGKSFGDLLFTQNLPEEVPAEELTDSEAEDLDLLLSQEFSEALDEIAEAATEMGFDVEKVKRVKRITSGL